ncbi:MAG TPA: hypothetical protein DCL21_02010 [Alphaproteobacteria bacterium]|nr:hypothetical protein [Alphaproteobacteria bacterium]
MFIMKRSNLSVLFAFAVFSLLSLNALAQEKTSDELKAFLSDSEFGLQRKVVKDAAVGQKGLITNTTETTDITDVISVDLIDPFANKAVKGTKKKLSRLDDGIDFTEEDIAAETLTSFRAKIEEYFAAIESQKDIDVVNLLNHLTINRIISSPLKYVSIMGKKYEEKDVIKVRVNRFNNDSEFQNMLNSMNVKTKDSEEAELFEEMKRDAMIRYDALTTNTDTALNIVKVKINEISKNKVSFIIDGKSYKLIMKK